MDKFVFISFWQDEPNVGNNTVKGGGHEELFYKWVKGQKGSLDWSEWLSVCVYIEMHPDASDR